MSELDEKIARLPVWARDLIKQLTARAEPNFAEMVYMRNRLKVMEEHARKQSARCEAMVAIMQAAAQGGHEMAKAFVERTLDDWGLTKGSER